MKSYGKSVLVSRKLISDFCMKYEIENELDAIKSLGLDSISLIKDDKSHEYFVVETQIDHEKIAPEMGFQIENKGGI